MFDVVISKNAEKKMASLLRGLQQSVSTTDISRRRTNNSWDFWNDGLQATLSQFVDLIFVENNQVLNRTLNKEEIQYLIQHYLFAMVEFGSIEIEDEKIPFIKLVNDKIQNQKFLAKIKADIEKIAKDFSDGSWSLLMSTANVDVIDEVEFDFGCITFFPKKRSFIEKYVPFIDEYGRQPYGDVMSHIERVFSKEKLLVIFRCSGCSLGCVGSRLTDILNRTFNVLRLCLALGRDGSLVIANRQDMDAPSKSVVSFGVGLGFSQGIWLQNDFYVAHNVNTAELPFTFDNKSLTKLKEFSEMPYIKAFLEKIGQDGLSEIDEAIAASLNWFAEGQANFHTLHQYVLFVIALEKILAYSTQDGISNLFEKRGAILMGNDVAAKKKFKRFYTIRSDIVHGKINTIAEIPDDFNVHGLGMYVPRVIEKLMKISYEQNFSKMEELYAYIENINYKKPSLFIRAFQIVRTFLKTGLV